MSCLLAYGENYFLLWKSNKLLVNHRRQIEKIASWNHISGGAIAHGYDIRTTRILKRKLLRNKRLFFSHHVLNKLSINHINHINNMWRTETWTLPPPSQTPLDALNPSVFASNWKCCIKYYSDLFKHTNEMTKVLRKIESQRKAEAISEK